MSDSSAITTLLKKVLRPLVRLMLRNGVAFADFSAVARRIFVEVASEDFGLPGRKQSVSRISVLTGVNRKEVKKLLDEPTAHDKEKKQNNRAARVVSGWMRDDEFRQKSGAPKALRWGNPDDEGGFEALVKRYSGDMTARAILDELVRVGAVNFDKEKSTVKLTANGYIPSASNDELMRLSGDSINDLLNTIEHNFTTTSEATRLQLSVAYDDVPESGAELFRNLSKEKSLELLNYLDQFLATQDRSVNPSVKGEGRIRTGLGIYYFEEPVEQHDNAQTGEQRETNDDEK